MGEGGGGGNGGCIREAIRIERKGERERERDKVGRGQREKNLNKIDEGVKVVSSLPCIGGRGVEL